MWLVTGDIHGIWSADCYKIRPAILEQKYNLKEIEGLIICGDFGGIWYGQGKPESKTENKKLDEMNRWGYPIYFVDGNHENYPAIMEYPVVEKFEGKMHEIRPNIHHLMRGEVYTINGKKVFALGGATSIDKKYRIEGVSWWDDEVPSEYDINNAKANLDKVGWNVDYVLTHCVPSDWLGKLFTIKQPDKATEIMQGIWEKLKYEHWYAGHYHIDKNLEEEKATIMYDYVCELGKVPEQSIIVETLEIPGTDGKTIEITDQMVKALEEYEKSKKNKDEYNKFDS